MEIAFDIGAARKVEERSWPGFQGIRELGDGRKVLQLRVAVTPEIVRWVLTWGASAEVFRPEDLRRRVGEILRAAAERYDHRPIDP